MRKKKAKQLKKEAIIMTNGKSATHTKSVYKKMKNIYKEIKGQL